MSKNNWILELNVLNAFKDIPFEVSQYAHCAHFGLKEVNVLNVG